MKRFLHGMLWMLALCVAGPAPVLAADAPKTVTFSTLPKAKPGGKWKIAYYEGGQYPDYEVILKATVRGMVALGWIQPLDIPGGQQLHTRWILGLSGQKCQKPLCGVYS